MPFTIAIAFYYKPVHGIRPALPSISPCRIINGRPVSVSGLRAAEGSYRTGRLCAPRGTGKGRFHTRRQYSLRPAVACRLNMAGDRAVQSRAKCPTRPSRCPCHCQTRPSPSMPTRAKIACRHVCYAGAMQTYCESSGYRECAAVGGTWHGRLAWCTWKQMLRLEQIRESEYPPATLPHMILTILSTNAFAA